MKQLRLSTLVLLIVIAALCVALFVQQDRASRREAELRANLAQSWPVFVKQRQFDEMMKIQHEYDVKLVRRINSRAQPQPEYWDADPRLW